MTPFLGGLLGGLFVGFVAGYLVYMFWSLPRVIEEVNRQGWIRPGPAAFDAAAKQRGRRT